MLQFLKKILQEHGKILYSMKSLKKSMFSVASPVQSYS